MSNSTNENGLSGWPGPLQFIAGMVSWLVGVVLGMIGGVLKAFPVTAPIGSPFVKLASEICYGGGFHMGQGIARSFRLLGRLIGMGIRQLRKKPTEVPTDQLFPPAR